RCYEQALEWQDLLPAPVRSLNLGGGFGIPYTPGEAALDLGPVIDNLGGLAQRLPSDWPGAHIVIELGRYLVGEAGVYVSRVVDRKVSRGQVFLVVDGGMHHHLAATGNFGQVIRRNYPVAINRTDLGTETASVVGPLCTPMDLLADRMELHRAEAGDLVVVIQSGAYGRSASPRGFLSHPDVAAGLVSTGSQTGPKEPAAGRGAFLGLQSAPATGPCRPGTPARRSGLATRWTAWVRPRWPGSACPGRRRPRLPRPVPAWRRPRAASAVPAAPGGPGRAAERACRRGAPGCRPRWCRARPSRPPPNAPTRCCLRRPRCRAGSAHWSRSRRCPGSPPA